MDRKYRRIPLTGIFNIRDLGGFPVDGGATRYGVFVRSEAPSGLPPDDVDALIAYGVRTVVDFRGDREVREKPSAFADVPGVRYVRSPAFNDQVAFGAEKKKSGPPITNHVAWSELYIEMLDDCREWFRETVETLAAADGCALYNCATGKDRVGLITMMLLGLAGVGDDDIVADYCVSEVYLTHAYVPMLEQYNAMFGGDAKLTDSFFRTSPENMRVTLAHIARGFGGIEAYAAACGISRAAVRRLREKFAE